MTRVPLPEPLPGPVTDTHTHLNLVRDTDEPLPVAEALAMAASVNVTKVVQVGVDVATSRTSVEIAQTYPQAVAAVALHPNEAPILAQAGALEESLAQIESLVGEPRVVAVGETGLDRFRTDGQGWADQEVSFRAHIDLARENDKTLVIHDRDAHADVIRVLESMPVPDRVVFHCFSGDVDMAEYCVRQGWFLSFSGTATFRNAGSVRDAIAATPAAQLLVETDAPFLTPHPHRGQVNSSYLVPWTVRTVAEVTQRDLEQVCAEVATATEAAFGAW